MEKPASVGILFGFFPRGRHIKSTKFAADENATVL
jgi:hypothetical protein